MTLAFDLLGRYLFDAERLGFDEFHALDGRSVFQRDVLDAVIQPLLLDANVLFALDDHGIRDMVTPLLGFEYSF